ncbi:MAG: hypothetical protein CV082_00565 [Candidatus Brocadia sp. BL1]|nr:MAG: hypothetical protein CV082_00565 [Candidatus Brocadia sp. BL1]
MPKKMRELHRPGYPRGASKVIWFYTFHTVDVTGHTVWASQLTDKQSIPLCKHLLKTWRNIGIPEVS